jgi:predicted ArsR family transcriptional regulator
MGDESLAEIDRTIGALQDPTRRRILLDFYVHQMEWTASDVAEAVGVHRTVAHGHLERLVALGYLVSSQRRGTSGKPAKLYRLAGREIDLSYPVRRFARLSALLAEGLRKSPDGVRLAREIGNRYGSSLVRRSAASPGPVLDELAPLGAEYRLVGDDEVLAENCIFRQACEVGEDVVCELHAGILEGALRGAGLDLRTAAFRNYSVKGCAYRLLTQSGPE